MYNTLILDVNALNELLINEVINKMNGNNRTKAQTESNINTHEYVCDNTY